MNDKAIKKLLNGILATIMFLSDVSRWIDKQKNKYKRSHR